MTDKDFLSQFSGTDKKPDSFKEEERIPVQKEKKPFNPLYVIIPVAVLLIAGFLVWFFLFRPNIPVVDFTGYTKQDVIAWVKQQDIETSGILFKEEYNFENEEGIVLYQEPAEGKVTKKAKISFYVSLGPDPDERVVVPDLKNMTKSEIESWIDINKLFSTKISTAYNEEYEEGKVYDLDFSGCSEDDFTRGCTLRISISKGEKPAEEVIMENYVGKTFEELQIWAESKGLKVSKVDTYSSTVASGTIIAHTPRAKEKIKTGDTITVSVSRGVAVVMPNLVGKSEEEAESWASKNESVMLATKEVFNNSPKGTVVNQNIPAGNIILEKVVLTVSKGNPNIYEFSGTTLVDLENWIRTMNESGANLSIGKVDYQNSDDVKVDEIIELPESITTGSSIDVLVSSGKNIWLEEEYYDAVDGTFRWSDVLGYTERSVRKLCELAGVTYEVVYEPSATVEPNFVISVKRDNNTNNVEAGYYISQSNVITVTICESKIEE